MLKISLLAVAAPIPSYQRICDMTACCNKQYKCYVDRGLLLDGWLIAISVPLLNRRHP
jgi:hypothetical protein